MKCNLTTSASSHATSTEECSSIKEAVWCFEMFADRAGLLVDRDTVEGVITDEQENVIYTLSIGPRGGVRKDKC